MTSVLKRAPGEPVPMVSTPSGTHYSISQAAALLGVSRVTIWRWIRAGQLPARRLGHRTVRIKSEDLEHFLVDREGANAVTATGQLPAATDDVLGADLIDAPRPDPADLAGPAGWTEQRSPGHFVQFYEDDAYLASSVSTFIGAALRSGHAGVLIATEAHRVSIEERLTASGLDLTAARADDQYITLNAAETLAGMTNGGEVAAERFAEIVGEVVERAGAGGRSVHIFGEMVALLVEQGEHDAVIRLEALWNRLRQSHDFSLMCGYSLPSLEGDACADLFGRVNGEHQQVMPTERYLAVADLEQRLRVIAELQQRSRSLQAEIARRQELETGLQAAIDSERVARGSVERAQIQAHFLAAASETLAASLDLESTLGNVARLAVPSVADWCVVDLAETDDAGAIRLRRISATHADPAKEALIDQLLADFPTVEASATHTALRVLRSGKPWFDPSVSPARLAAESRSPEHLAITRALGFASEMVLPLVAHDRVVGTITLVGGEGRTFDGADLALAEELARRCALAIVNAEAFAAEEAARRDAQRAAERMSRLQEITGQLSESLESERVLESIARSAADLLQAPVGAVFLLDRGDPNGDFALAAAHGIDRARAPELRLPRHASLAGRAIDAGRTLVVDDVQGEQGTALPELLTGLTTGSEIAAPITAAGVGLGVVKVFSPSLRRFSPDDAALLTTLAAAAAVALTNARLYREAQDAIRTRDEFLSAAAHDLKTPLTSIKGMSQVLGRQVSRIQGPGTERLSVGLARIDATATKMGQQLDELLDLTRLQMGQQLELRRGPVDLVDLSRRVAAEQQQVTQRHTLRVETAHKELVGTWDGVRLGRVLENLLSNAIKYSPSGGDIVVALATERVDGESSAVVSVTDHGIGVPAAELLSIFARFQRAANVQGRIGGTGIGLASVRQIVGQHGGSISVESVEGAGSTFTVRLPLSVSEGCASVNRPIYAAGRGLEAVGEQQ